MCLDLDPNQRVAHTRRAALALTFEANRLTVGYAFGNGNVHGTAIRHGDTALAAARRFGEADADAVFLVAALGAAPAGTDSAGAAEQVTENILDIETAGKALEAAAGAATAPLVLILPTLLAGSIDLAAVITLTHGRVGKDGVGGGNLLEALLDRSVAGVAVRMELLREAAIGLFDVVLAGAAIYPEHLV